MLKIRLARAWKRNMAFFRIVLTEHTKAPQHGYKEVLWFYNPFTKEFSIKDVEKLKEYKSKWVQLSSRMEKLLEKNNIAI